MRKNDQLEQQVITPTTKSASHDVPISAEDILQQGIVSQQDWDQVDNPRVTYHVHLATLLEACQSFPFSCKIRLKLLHCVLHSSKALPSLGTTCVHQLFFFTLPHAMSLQARPGKSHVSHETSEKPRYTLSLSL